MLGFRTRPNMERLEQELENPQTRKQLQEVVEQVTGTPYEVRLHLATDTAAATSRPRGHMVRQARALGVQIVGEEEAPVEQEHA
jgi:hypothetical protein